jgi:uncharacterized protein (DUF1501 family)
MNRRTLLKHLAALPFVGALFSKPAVAASPKPKTMAVLSLHFRDGVMVGYQFAAPQDETFAGLDGGRNLHLDMKFLRGVDGAISFEGQAR